MSYRVIFTEGARRDLRAIPEDDREEIIEVIRVSLAEDPFAGKPLEEEWEGRYSYRVWPYRIIYRIQERTVTITIVAIGHRRDVYRKR